MTAKQQAIDALRRISGKVRDAESDGVLLTVCRECGIVWETSGAYEGHQEACSVGVARATLALLESEAPARELEARRASETSEASESNHVRRSVKMVEGIREAPALPKRNCVQCGKAYQPTAGYSRACAACGGGAEQPAPACECRKVLELLAEESYRAYDIEADELQCLGCLTVGKVGAVVHRKSCRFGIARAALSTPCRSRRIWKIAEQYYAVHQGGSDGASDDCECPPCKDWRSYRAPRV